MDGLVSGKFLCRLGMCDGCVCKCIDRRLTVGILKKKAGSLGALPAFGVGLNCFTLSRSFSRVAGWPHRYH